MKKIYISPNTLVVKISMKHHMMIVSYGEENVNSMDYSSVISGSEQLTRENKSVWDEEW